jgi:hypothetical protein
MVLVFFYQARILSAAWLNFEVNVYSIYIMLQIIYFTLKVTLDDFLLYLPVECLV